MRIGCLKAVSLLSSQIFEEGMPGRGKRSEVTKLGSNRLKKSVDDPRVWNVIESLQFTG